MPQEQYFSRGVPIASSEEGDRAWVEIGGGREESMVCESSSRRTIVVAVHNSSMYVSFCELTPHNAHMM